MTCATVEWAGESSLDGYILTAWPGPLFRSFEAPLSRANYGEKKAQTNLLDERLKTGGSQTVSDQQIVPVGGYDS